MEEKKLQFPIRYVSLAGTPDNLVRTALRADKTDQTSKNIKNVLKVS
ncbi:hypothetical protein [Sinorhizobium arboris]|nr:hypothetical protein [Sinorhizobium arboris]